MELEPLILMQLFAIIIGGLWVFVGKNPLSSFYLTSIACEEDSYAIYRNHLALDAG